LMIEGIWAVLPAMTWAL